MEMAHAIFMPVATKHTKCTIFHPEVSQRSFYMNLEKFRLCSPVSGRLRYESWDSGKISNVCPIIKSSKISNIRD
jgi:hypothetical protein